MGPQLEGSVFATQLSPQLRVPSGQTPPQGLPTSMQAPLHRVVPAGHSVPHWLPLQVALPPVGDGQAVQLVPQVCGSVSFTQRGPQA